MKVYNRGVLVQDGQKGFALLNNPLYPKVNPRTATSTDKTSDFTITAMDQIYTNTGASGTVVFTLPSVRNNAGKALTFHAFAAQIIRCLPQTGEAVNLNGSAVVTKYLNIAAVIGNYADLYCDGSQWIVTGYSGVVTKEA